MEAFLQTIKHLKISLEKIKLATNNFDNNNIIGKGAFGVVFEGVLSHSKGQSMVAFKCLDRRHGQGDAEFFKEIVMLSRCTDENVISLLGFCDEEGEKILVYEHAPHGSVDSHLCSPTLTWWKRLKIAVTAAKGLCYLHDPKGTHQRVIHRDIKSSNILLDENWNAKISDMGLSKVGPADQLDSFLATNVVGTFGYIDPLYLETYSLTKESDVYSYGVVMFELLCGRPCFEYNNRHFKSLVPIWKKSFEEKKLDEIIFEDLKQHMDLRSLRIFSDIAYRCLQKSREDRPTMSCVVEELEIAIQFQKMEQPLDYEELSMTAVRPLVYESKDQLQKFLYRGILVNGGKTWFSINKNGEHHELISAAECFILIKSSSEKHDNYRRKRSRFPVDYHAPLCREFKIHVKTQYLSPGVTYAVNLVFDTNSASVDLLFLDYRLAGKKKYSTSFIADRRADGWFMTELYQFTSDKRSVDFEITFRCRRDMLFVEGIEFWPVERVQEHQVSEDVEVDMHTDTYREQKMPSGYQDIIKQSNDCLQWTTKEELYSILCKGFPIKNVQQLFSLAKDGKKCHMVPASEALLEHEWRWGPSPYSRFKQVAYFCQSPVHLTVTSRTLSPLTRYACYLVYNMKTKTSNLGQVIRAVDMRVMTNNSVRDPWYMLLLLPKIPVIKQNVVDNTHNPLTRNKIEGLPHRRDDGWLEVLLWKCQTGSKIGDHIVFDLLVSHMSFKNIKGFVVLGIEFKAM